MQRHFDPHGLAQTDCKQFKDSICPPGSTETTKCEGVMEFSVPDAGRSKCECAATYAFGNSMIVALSVAWYHQGPVARPLGVSLLFGLLSSKHLKPKIDALWPSCRWQVL